MKSTIEDVAKAAGVSITTVSRVINSNYPVKKETKERVQRVIDSMNYRPNPLARGLINKKTNTIGVEIPGMTNMFFTEVLQGIETDIKRRGYDIFVTSTEGDASMEKNCTRKLTEKLVDGIIVIDPQTENMKSGYFEKAASQMPFVFVNGYHENINANFVISSEEKGTRQALESIISCGHTKIAFLRGGTSHSYELKESIYREFMKSIKEEPIIIFAEEGNSIDVVENTSKKIQELSKKYNYGKDITAFFACNDLMAVGIMNGLNALGISVPKDVSIVGFDNIILSQMTVPKLTTVDQNMRLLGKRAAEMIMNLIDTKLLYNNWKYVDTFLVPRDSLIKIK